MLLLTYSLTYLLIHLNSNYIVDCLNEYSSLAGTGNHQQSWLVQLEYVVVEILVLHCSNVGRVLAIRVFAMFFLALKHIILPTLWWLISTILSLNGVCMSVNHDVKILVKN